MFIFVNFYICKCCRTDADEVSRAMWRLLFILHDVTPASPLLVWVHFNLLHWPMIMSVLKRYHVLHKSQNALVQSPLWCHKGHTHLAKYAPWLKSTSPALCFCVPRGIIVSNKLKPREFSKICFSALGCKQRVQYAIFCHFSGVEGVIMYHTWK